MKTAYFQKLFLLPTSLWVAARTQHPLHSRRWRSPNHLNPQSSLSSMTFHLLCMYSYTGNLCVYTIIQRSVNDRLTGEKKNWPKRFRKPSVDSKKKKRNYCHISFLGWVGREGGDYKGRNGILGKVKECPYFEMKRQGVFPLNWSPRNPLSLNDLGCINDWNI